jgi:hypothetical protein
MGGGSLKGNEADCSVLKGIRQGAVFDGKGEKRRHIRALPFDWGAPSPRLCASERTEGPCKRTDRENDMKRKLVWLTLVNMAMVVGGSYYAKSVLATPQNAGFKATTIATGTFDEIDVFNQATKHSLPAGNNDNVWLSLQKTMGKSDLYVQSNTWEAVNRMTGAMASTGWHTHPGHSLIIVTAGTLTEYEGSDCTKHVYTFVAGQPAPTLIDSGHGHAHLIRNEGNVPASSIAVQLVPFDPAKQNRRIDEPAPDNCTNIN